MSTGGNETITACVRRIWKRNTQDPNEYKTKFDTPAKGVVVHQIVPIRKEDSKSAMFYYDSHGKLDKIADACTPVTFLALKKLECTACTLVMTQCFQTVPPGAIVIVEFDDVQECCP